MTDQATAGSVDEFRRSWRQRNETRRYHFSRQAPQHQVQFAFQNHWRVFSDVLKGTRLARVLEVGSGRGSMGAFFANHGCETHLLDTSYDVLASARELFSADGLTCRCHNGDALWLPYAASSFDAIFSIGLLEHFEEVRLPLLEQLRVLRPGGMLLCYVVPENRFSVQLLAAPVNLALKLGDRLFCGRADRGSPKPPAKSPLYRNRYASGEYLQALAGAGVTEMGAFGMFPLPLVSHSHAFPFSPMAPGLEKALMGCWRVILGLRRLLLRRDPWTCSERWGLAFLVWARKPGGAA
jgi:SAM-dependent methyltransferase